MCGELELATLQQSSMLQLTKKNTAMKYVKWQRVGVRGR